MDKDLQADIDKLSRLVRQVSECVGTYKILDERNYIFSPTEFIRLYEVSKGSVEALDRIIARIPEPSSKEDCVFKNCEFYGEDVDGHCNGGYCGGPAQEFCKWYEYLQKDREIRKPKPAPGFDAIAREIESNAYQSGTFFPALCAQILRKHFGKEE